ncbi:hypothetical protein [Microbacterium sp. NPDC089696]|uniref:hypothetical protein n=1 Tax=Microbacterium sp. NPDC089696 TaxID=3364199 RepID=UPI0037F85511
MSVSHFSREVFSEGTRVHGGAIAELITAAYAYQGVEGATWRVEDNGVVFERPMGEQISGRDER